jgi:hypothetical protein
MSHKSRITYVAALVLAWDDTCRRAAYRVQWHNLFDYVLAWQADQLFNVQILNFFRTGHFRQGGLVYIYRKRHYSI